MQFTALLHHITPQVLVQSFYARRRDASVGMDGMSWREYEEGLLRFDEIDHEWMLMFPGHRIADLRLLGLICKWLQAGVMEDARGDVIIVHYAVSVSVCRVPYSLLSLLSQYDLDPSL